MSDLTAVRRAYDAVATDYAAHLPDTRAEARPELDLIDQFVASIRQHGVGGDGADEESPLVLDAGCGSGRMSRHLAERGLTVVGVDLSPGMMAQARVRDPTAALAVGALSSLPFADARFDGVLLWYSTIHTTATGQPALYAEAARVLRSGGQLLVGFQHGSGERDLAATYRRFGHEIVLRRYRFTVDEVSDWLAGVGLDVVQRLVRDPEGNEGDPQGFVHARARAAR